MTVSEAVTRSKTLAFFSKGSIKAAQQMLSPTETVLWAQISNVYTNPVRGELSTDGLTKGMLSGVIVVTDRRVFFVNQVLGRGMTKEIPLYNVQSIDSKYGNLYGCLRIIGMTDMIVTTCSRELAQQLRAVMEEALANWQTRTDVTATPALDTAQLQALKQLYDSGVLTEEEFGAKKAQILGL